MCVKTNIATLTNYNNEDMTLPVTICFNVYDIGDVELGAVISKTTPYSTGDDIVLTFTITNNSSTVIDNATLEGTINNSITNIQYSIDGGTTKKHSSNNLSISLTNLQALSDTRVYVYGKVT